MKNSMSGKTKGPLNIKMNGHRYDCGGIRDLKELQLVSICARQGMTIKVMPLFAVGQQSRVDRQHRPRSRLTRPSCFYPLTYCVTCIFPLPFCSGVFTHILLFFWHYCAFLTYEWVAVNDKYK